MKKTALFFLTLLLSLSIFAQKEINDANAQVRNVEKFHGVNVSSGITLTLTQGTTAGVAVSADDLEVRDRVITEVENGVLKIYIEYERGDWKFWRRSDKKRIRAYVSAVELDKLGVSAGATMRIEGEVKADKLDLHVSSGAIFKGAVDVAGELRVDQSSGAETNISGKAGNLSLDGSSGSTFRGYDLVVENADVDNSSGSSTEVTIKKELTAEASSGGSIRYRGDAVIKNIRTGSGGAVSKRG